MKSETPYNPLDKNNLGASVAEALLERDKIAMENIEPFIGAGIYAIYYVGDREPYQILGVNEFPIYVGKAVPPGARKGNFGLNTDPGQGPLQKAKGTYGKHQTGFKFGYQDFSMSVSCCG